MVTINELKFKSEKIGFKWILENTNYTEDDIEHNHQKSPDFICRDGNGFEVKKLINKGKRIVFTQKQMENMKGYFIILVYKNEVINVVPFEELNNLDITVGLDKGLTPGGKWLTKKQKNMISYLCRNTSKSYSQIGDFLGVHKNTVSKYKGFNL